MDEMGDEMPQDGKGPDPNKTPQQQKQQGGEKQDGQSGEKQDGQSGDSGSDTKDKNDTDKKSNTGKSTDDKEEQKKKEEDAKTDLESQKKRAEEKKQDEKQGKTSGTVPSSIDDAIKKNASQLEKSQNDTDRETKTGMNKDAMKPGTIASMMAGDNGTGKNSADGNPYSVGEKQYIPKLNWKAMLKKMVPSGLEKTETYAKPSRRTTSSMVSIAQTGVGVVKPGTKESDSEKRGLCFILDNSGSTMGKIGEMQSDIMTLLQKESKKLNGEMYVMKFSNDVHYFKVDVKTKKYARITDVAEFISTGHSKVKCDTPIASLFKTTYGGATELTAKITMAAKTLFDLKFNVVLFSDVDIVAGSNATQLQQIFNFGKKQLAVIGCDKNDYEAFVNLLGSKSNITYYS